MNRLALCLVAAVLAACVHGAPVSLSDLHAKEEWRDAPGKSVDAAYARNVKRALSGMTREEALTALVAEQYECAFGEASEDYKEPMAVCSRYFATRACAGEWTISLATPLNRPGRFTIEDTRFTRDCVGMDGDWPEPKKSAIDDQLAPPPPLQ